MCVCARARVRIYIYIYVCVCVCACACVRGSSSIYKIEIFINNFLIDKVIIVLRFNFSPPPSAHIYSNLTPLSTYLYSSFTLPSTHFYSTFTHFQLTFTRDLAPPSSHLNLGVVLSSYIKRS